MVRTQNHWDLVHQVIEWKEDVNGKSTMERHFTIVCLEMLAACVLMFLYSIQASFAVGVKKEFFYNALNIDVLFQDVQCLHANHLNFFIQTTTTRAWQNLIVEVVWYLLLTKTFQSFPKKNGILIAFAKDVLNE